MTGIGEAIELTIDEVFDFPQRTSWRGGYDAKGTLKIRAGGLSAHGALWVSTGELYRFFVELQKCYDSVGGIARFASTEKEFEMSCEFNRLGHVDIRGRYQECSYIDNTLIFQIKTDQTQVRESLRQLKSIYRLFGDEKGIKPAE